MRKTIEVKKPVRRRSRSRSVSKKITRSRSKSVSKKPTKRSTSKRKITKKKSIKKKITKKSQKGGDIVSASIGTINSAINLGKSIGDEVNALMNMGKDFNRAADVKLPNDKTPDSFTATTGQNVNPTFPAARV